MADRAISTLVALTAPASNDVFVVVDASEPASADKNKQLSFSTLHKTAPDGSVTSPSIGFLIPSIKSINVVFPSPDCPTKPTKSPWSIFKFAFIKIGLLVSYEKDRSLISIDLISVINELLKDSEITGGD